MTRNLSNIGIISEIGDVKESNQDSFLYKYEIIRDKQAGLFVIADGMGGLSYGEEISSFIITFLNRWWTEKLIPVVSSRENYSSDSISNMLDSGIYEVNKYAIGFSKQVDKKAGSTLSLLLVIDSEYFIKNVGDSRVYLIRKNRKLQLTEDQSLVADMVRRKEITEEEAREHKKRNVLTMCLGIFDDIRIFSRIGKVQAGDIFLICCDGFYNYVPDDIVVPIIKDSKHRNFNEKVKLLRSQIPAGAAKDNISIILVQFGNYGMSLERIAVPILFLLLSLIGYLLFIFWR